MSNLNENPNPVACKLVPEVQRIAVAASLWGPRWPIQVEPTCWNLAEKLAPDYPGGLWNYFEISNNGFFAAPAETESFTIGSNNYFSGVLAPELFGVVVCLLTYYHLSFAGDWEKFPRLCARHHHLLRQYAMGLPAVADILRAID